jgi:lysine-N-methylase
MHLLGVLARRLESLSGARSVVDWADSNPAPVAQMLADSARVVTLQRLRPTMDGMHPDSAAQLQLVMELLRTRLAQPPVSPRFLECVQDFESGMGCCTATCEAEILSTYADALRLYYQPFMTRNPHILENYLANHIFKNHYPFTHPGDRNPDLQRDQPDAETEHLVLCVHLAIIQTILIGIAGHYRGAFAETHVVKLIQSFARTFEHSRESQDQFKTFLQTHNLKRLGGIALLLQVSPVLPNGVVAEVPGIAGPSVAVDGVECTRQSRAPRREWDHNTCCEAFSAEPQDVQGLTGGSE